MFDKVLIANRGEIAVRIARTLKRMGVTSVAVYSDSDRESPHVRACDEAIALGGNTAAESYLQGDRIIELAVEHGVQAVIPGYGFLSENAEFAERCAEHGIAFVGPTPSQLRLFGLKHTARELADTAGVPLAPGTDLLDSLEDALTAADHVGYPVMLKSTAGGGGIGLRRCADADELTAAFEAVAGMGSRFFGDGGVFVERFVDQARHVEVQIFGDGKGQVVALGERDCSLQRRNQKVIEETPAPGLPEATRSALLDAAVRLGESVHYQSAGTVEFIYDANRDAFYFLEVNTRLQVEHPVTEMVTERDLVEWMIRIAAGESVDLTPPSPQGAAVEARVYAEEPLRDFQPSPGRLTQVVLPKGPGIRVDTWVETGTTVPAQFDPMLAKIICHGRDRNDALAKLGKALAETRFDGIATNLELLRALITLPDYVDASHDTKTIDRYLAISDYHPRAVEVLQPGTYTTIQDYPGRLGFWHIGVPPSGPMDDYAFRMANRIVGNHRHSAGLECTLLGPTLRFHRDALVAITGAPVFATLDDEPVSCWRPVAVRAGQVLKLGQAETGVRSYIAIRGGLDVPAYLDSRATFALGAFGGHAGRILQVGDTLLLGCHRAGKEGEPPPMQPGLPVPNCRPGVADAALIPDYPDVWDIGVMYGPHGAPDFFKSESIQQFFDTEWTVHYNSNRLGIRLEGPRLSWARTDGGEAGLHPSNIHDTEYAVGSINFTGDMPVILTRDGPSLGGFVCPVTIVRSELWKVGQVKPGDKLRFRAMSFAEARELEDAVDQQIDTLKPVATAEPDFTPATLENIGNCILLDLPAEGSTPRRVIRQAGDGYVLIEYGENVLDLALRMRVHALMSDLESDSIPGILECSPGVRSLQIRYEPRQIEQSDLVRRLSQRESRLPAPHDIRIPSRILHLPMAFEDSATLDAVAKYRQSVRDTAPWLPSNTEFMRRINGLPDIEAVRNTLYEASYMVLGLGDVYLGAPCAVPLDPRHRLLTSKYNPARTYTAEGTVGIGGVYMCIYGMDSPGGYQLVGRTLPIWNRRAEHPYFTAGKPWLLRFFDQVRYFPVSEAELNEMRRDFAAGTLPIEVTETVFDLKEHDRFLAENAEDIAAFQQRQQAAYREEVSRWTDDDTSGLITRQSAVRNDDLTGEPVPAHVSGNIWKVLVAAGEEVSAGQPLVIVEAMKMEFSIEAPRDGVVANLCCDTGELISIGHTLLTLEH